MKQQKIRISKKSMSFKEMAGFKYTKMVLYNTSTNVSA